MQTVYILLGAFGACAFFSLMFNTPRRCLLPCSLVGTAGYGAYMLLDAVTGSPVAGAFAAGLLIALISELLARRLKAPAILFASVGVIPLVPGGGLYNTMLYMTQGDYGSAISEGVSTILIAGSIALSIALVSSFFRVRR